jgi:hypothetical protein
LPTTIDLKCDEIRTNLGCNVGRIDSKCGKGGISSSSKRIGLK